MSRDWRKSINQTSATFRLANVSTYVAPDSAASPLPSPIDRFYESTRELLRAAHPDLIRDHPAMGALFLVGLVSATENYFRDIFARVIKICPVAQSESADESIHLGSVVWHGGLDAERGAFEHMSFAAAKNVRNTALKFLGYKIKQHGDTNAVLEEFDKVCELRHGVVHSGAILAGKNAIKLGVSRANATLKIQLGFAQVQECGAICTTLVVAFNSELFEEMAARWAKQWRGTPSWDPAYEKERFRSIWDNFYSAIDQRTGQIPVSLSMEQCMHAAFAELG